MAAYGSNRVTTPSKRAARLDYAIYQLCMASSSPIMKKKCCRRTDLRKPALQRLPKAKFSYALARLLAVVTLLRRAVPSTSCLDLILSPLFGPLDLIIANPIV